MQPKILINDTNEYFRLEMFCKILNRDSPNKCHYEIEDIYFDVGQDWLWTTIVNKTKGCQILSARQWESIILDKVDIEIMEEEIFTDKYSQDKYWCIYTIDSAGKKTIVKNNTTEQDCIETVQNFGPTAKYGQIEE